MAADPSNVLIVRDVAAWRAWLDGNEDVSDGVWLVLAKKGVIDPTSLTYAQALDEALCSGWIDGQKRSRDEATFQQRFTPRRSRSIWSQRNVGIIDRLEAEGRMRPRGRDEVAKAKADGRWDRAYGGQADMQVPEDLASALAAVPGARERFEALPKSQQFSAVFGVTTAVKEATRAARIERIVQFCSTTNAS